MNNEYPYIFHEHIRDNIQAIVEKIGKPNTVIEIGVFEGYFTFNMTNTFAKDNPNYTHYAIDPFNTSDDLEKDRIQEAFEKFYRMYKQYHYMENIVFYQTGIKEIYPNLLQSGVKADIIYIDGSHLASDVLEDLVFSWQLLNVGGAIICDDTGSWMFSEKNGNRPLQKSPRIAVEGFINCNWDKIELVHLPNNWQTAFIKRCE